MLLKQKNEVIAALNKAGLKCIEKLYDGKWMSAACKCTNDKADPKQKAARRLPS